MANSASPTIVDTTAASGEPSGINLDNIDFQELLSSGVDLRQYSLQIADRLRCAENASIGDYVRQSCHITSLHEQLTACDDTLARMESTLRNFQQDLGSISHEIMQLQQQSVCMNQRLKRQQAARSRLSQFVDEISVPETTVRHIVSTDVSQQDFIDQLCALDQKLVFMRSQNIDEVAACRDVLPVLQKLRIKAVAKLREFLLDKIYQFRKPMTNFHVPQNTLLKHKMFWAFLYAHAGDVAAEVRHEYVDTVSKVYCTYFKQYWSRLLRLLHEDGPSRSDLLVAVEDTVASAAARSFFSVSRGPPPLKHRSNTVFSLGDRADVLQQLELPAIVPHVNVATSSTGAGSEVRYPIEQIYRSSQYVLADNACREYLFLAEFFAPALSGCAEISQPSGGVLSSASSLAVQELFTAVFGRTVANMTRQSQTLAADSHDSIGLLLCVHLVHRLHLLCHKRAVPALDSYWERQLQLLWPPFERVVELNVNSVRQCDTTAVGVLDTRPTPATRRYAEYAAAILSINEQFPSERVHRLLMRLRVEMENLLLRLAAEFQQRHDQLIFLINNYDLIVGVLLERTAGAVNKDTDTFRELLARRCDEYVESVLAGHFGGLIQFVKDGEVLVDSGGIQRLEDHEHQRTVARLVESFNKSWRQALQDINSRVMQSFSNFSSGSAILQDALKLLLIYCDRFHKLLGLCAQLRSYRDQIVNVHTVMIEVKKYKPNF